MTPYYVTGAFCLTALASFFLGRLTANDDYEPENREARGRQPSDLK